MTNDHNESKVALKGCNDTENVCFETVRTTEELAELSGSRRQASPSRRREISS